MAADSPPRLNADRLDRAFELVEGQVRAGVAPYAALAVARSDGLVRSAAWDRQGEVTEPRRSAVASITKPIVATAILQLVEQGALVLLEPVRTYLPGFQPVPPSGTEHAPEPVTPWHVLTHTSGLGNPPDEFYFAAGDRREAFLDWLGASTLQFAPGTAYAYASESFYALSATLERLAEMPYPEYLAERVFAPLGMTATTFDPYSPGPAPVPLTGDFGIAGADRETAVGVFIRLAMPGGGLWSTPGDIARFGRAMLNGGTLDGQRLLGRPFVRLMTRHHTDGIRELGTGRRPTYGLGWGLPGLARGSPASASAFGHSGATGSLLVVDPEYDLVVVYLRNEWGAATAPTDAAIQAVYAALE